jgi:hypothetical protein
LIKFSNLNYNKIINNILYFLSMNAFNPTEGPQIPKIPQLTTPQTPGAEGPKAPFNPFPASQGNYDNATEKWFAKQFPDMSPAQVKQAAAKFTSQMLNDTTRIVQQRMQKLRDDLKQQQRDNG